MPKRTPSTIPTTLINFHMPNYLKSKFDKLSDVRGISKTHMLVQFVETLVEEWEPKIEKILSEQKELERKNG